MFAAVLQLALPLAAFGAQEVQVTLPTFPITLNDVAINVQNSQYPFLVYKDITYIPMTYEDARLLGLATEWTAADGLSINQSVYYNSERVKTEYKGYSGETTNAAQQTATIAEFAVSVARVPIDNQAEEYPLLVFRDVTYFPLTWRFAVEEFGWRYSFNETHGLVINPPVTIVTSPEEDSNHTNTSIGGDALSSVKKIQVNGSVVNIRSKASIEADVVTKVQDGEILDVLGVSGQWYQVLANGQVGWIAGWLAEPVQSDGNAMISGGSHDLTQQSMSLDGTLTTAVFNIGQNNGVVVSSAANDNVTFAIDNNTTELFQKKSVVGAITGIEVSQVGSKALLSIQTIDGAVVTAQAENGLLTITARDRYANGGRGLKGKIIVVDPGHGNLKENGVVDPGTVGLIMGYTDREVGYHIGDKLRNMLEAQGAVVIMTREEEPVVLELSDRPVIANGLRADAFVSIHGNALENNTSKNGAEVYYYADKKYLTPSAQAVGRKALAEAVNKGILAATGRNSVVKDFQNYLVLRETECVSILVEAGYLSNAEDEALLAADSYQEKMALGIFSGLEQFFQ